MRRDKAQGNLVPSTNLVIYEQLYLIEVGLRELIIEALGALTPKWTKQRLPNDLREKIVDGMRIERSTKWTESIPHHPAYYLDFPDLAKIILRNDNWDQVFKSIFSNKEVLTSTLRELETPRNKVAHNRKATATDTSLTTAAYNKLTSLIGEPRLMEFAERCSTAADLPERIQELEREATAGIVIVQELSVIDSLPCWEEVCRVWWFDSDFLDVDLAPIEDYFKSLEAYRSVPRGRGQGHVVEAWVRTVNIKEKFDAASKIFDALRVRSQ